MKSVALVLLVLLLTPLASAGAEEFALPDGWKGPTRLAFDGDGALWLTLDGNWAIGRYDPVSKNGTLYPLPVPRVRDAALGGLGIASDGTVWVGTPRNLLQFHPENATFAQFPLPGTSIVSGDVHIAPDGIIWYALTSADMLLRLDPTTGNTTQFPLPDAPFGPLEFREDPAGGFYLTATYGNTYARYDPATSALEMGRATVQGPVGIGQDAQGDLWIAEMGASSISRVTPASDRLERYPTTYSPYYPLSGPAGVQVDADGIVWFVEHFADRVSRLDPKTKTLHEYEVPSAPGTNVQFLARAADGSLWFAQATGNRVGRVTFTNESVSAFGPDAITLHPGAKAEFDLPADAVRSAGAHAVAAGPGPWLNATIENGKLVVSATASAALTHDAAGAATGVPVHYVLLSTDHGSFTSGRYIPVTIAPAKADTPAIPLLAMLGILVIAAFARRRRA